MDIHGQNIKQIASNTVLSGSLALTGIGIEALAHNPLFLFAGGAVAYVSWKYDAGGKVLALKNQLANGEEITVFNKVTPVRPAPAPVIQGRTIEVLPDTEELDDIYAAHQDDVLPFGVEVATGLRFEPLIDDLAGKGMLIAGSQGAGKSNQIGLIAQGAGTVRMPLLIIDFKGEFYTLSDVLPNGIVAGHPDAAYQFPHGFYPLTSENTRELAADLMEGPFQVVLDVPSYNGDNDEVAAVISSLLHAMMDWSAAIKRGGGEPWPCFVVTDEAHNFLPERKNLSALLMQKPEASFAALTKAYSRMANAGRSFGYTLVMATQRLPNIAKWSIANLQTKVIMVHSEKNDLDACENETGGMVDRETVKRLPQGTGIVIGFTQDPIIVKFDMQLARHVSNTPKLAQLRQQFSGKGANSRPQVAFRETTERHVPSTPRIADLPTREPVNELVMPYKASEPAVNGNDAIHDVHSEEPALYTNSEAAEVIKAYGTMTKQGLPTTRKNMVEWMNKNIGNHWNTGSKSYPKFQAICEEYGF